MNKLPIKVIKRIDAEAMACDKAQIAGEPRQTGLVRQHKIESLSRRKMDATVSSWISARRKKTRVEEIAAVHEVFGNKILLGTT